MCEKDYIWNPSRCTFEYLESSIGDSVVIHEKNIEMTKTVPENTLSEKTISTRTIPKTFNEKRLL